MLCGWSGAGKKDVEPVAEPEGAEYTQSPDNSSVQGAFNARAAESQTTAEKYKTVAAVATTAVKPAPYWLGVLNWLAAAAGVTRVDMVKMNTSRKVLLILGDLHERLAGTCQAQGNITAQQAASSGHHTITPTQTTPAEQAAYKGTMSQPCPYDTTQASWSS